MTMELERRHFEVDRLEIRGTGDSRTVRGLGVPYNRKSEDMGGWREVIAPGAATNSVASNDIALLWQHDQTQPISRVSASRVPLVLEERKTGVWFEQDASAFTEYQLDKLADGVVHQMSFGFYAEEQEWAEESKPVLRTINQMNLLELSPVTFPAYPSTKVALRCAAEAGVVLPISDTDPTEALTEPNPADVQRMMRNQLDVTVARAGLGR
jgi:HK97 family phage prohead protease